MLKRTVIHTEYAPAAVGPYSQAIVAGNLVFTAGQVGLDPETKKLVEGVQEQTRRALQNIDAILEVAGTGLDRVVKTTVFLQDMNDFAAMNEIYAQFFPENQPARSTVQVAKLPLGALVEIEVIAFVD
jgi:2-iminobutanoate/2-iminopropanoate deaminase